MRTGKVISTKLEIDAALQRARNLASEIRLVEVRYDPHPGFDVFAFTLSDGSRRFIGRENLQGLQKARKKQLSNMEILGDGTGIHWPDLNIDLYLPPLLDGIYGNKAWMTELGRRGGTVRSKAKTEASRTNGQKGGRPKAAEAVRLS